MKILDLLRSHGSVINKFLVLGGQRASITLVELLQLLGFNDRDKSQKKFLGEYTWPSQ